MLNADITGELLEAAVQVCGQAFYYRDSLRGVFVSAGVPPELYDRYNVETSSKFVVARQVLTALAGQGPAERAILLRIINDLANLSGPVPTATDPAAGEQAIRQLQTLAARQRVLVSPEDNEREQRRKEQAQRERIGQIRRETLAALNGRLLALTRSQESAQRRGYELERLLVDLFAAFDIQYRPPYRLPREQVDGAFDYRSFAYLVEARWRSRPPDFGDLADFKGKVDGKLEGTRGIFLSMAGFDMAVVNHFAGVARGTRNNLLLVDGRDLALILQGQVSLSDALDYKIRRASQEGVWFASLGDAM